MGATSKKFLLIRVLIGVIAISLPITLYLADLALPDLYTHDVHDPKSSFSAYYYSDLRDPLVLLYGALGTLLLLYQGYSRVDAAVAAIGGVAAFLLALTPHFLDTHPCERIEEIGPCYSLARQVFSQNVSFLLNSAHAFCGLLLFICMMVFCLFLFPINQRKSLRVIYKSSGRAILICICLLVANHFNHTFQINILGSRNLLEFIGGSRSVFYLEGLGTLCFGVAWLTKSRFWLAGNKNAQSNKASNIKAEH